MGLGTSGIAGEEPRSWSDVLSLLQALIGHAANTFVNVFLGKSELKWFVYNHVALLQLVLPDYADGQHFWLLRNLYINLHSTW